MNDAVKERLVAFVPESTWPEPDIIKEELLPVTPFDFDWIPGHLSTWMKDVSSRMQCPPDYIFVGLYVMISSLVGIRCVVRPFQNDDWEVIPNSWGAVVGPPGSMKTPALNQCLNHLTQLEFEANEMYQSAKKIYASDLFEHEAQIGGLKRAMTNAFAGGQNYKGRNPEEIKKLLDDIPEMEVPILRRYRTNDVTVEKVALMLNDNPNGLLMFRDEIIGWLAGMEKQNHQSDRAFWLETWNGGQTYNVDRVTRDPIKVENMCMSILGGIQPERLTRYLVKCMESIGNDGLIQRLQFLVFPDQNKTKWKVVDKTPDEHAKAQASRVIKQLAGADLTKYGAIVEDGAKYPYLRFSQEAQLVFNEWLTDLENNKIRDPDADPIIAEHLSKYRSLFASIALIDHLIERLENEEQPRSGLSVPISKLSALRAAEICDYLETHARRVFAYGRDSSQQAAIALATKIITGKLEDGFAVRDVQLKEWKYLTKNKNIESACGELVEANWLRVKPRPELTKEESAKGGRPAATRYEINPKPKVRAENPNIE